MIYNFLEQYIYLNSELVYFAKKFYGFFKTVYTYTAYFKKVEIYVLGSRLPLNVANKKIVKTFLARNIILNWKKLWKD